MRPSGNLKRRTSYASCSRYRERIKTTSLLSGNSHQRSEIHCNEDGFISFVISVFIRREQKPSKVKRGAFFTAPREEVAEVERGVEFGEHVNRATSLLD